MQSIMSESLIDNSIIATKKTTDHENPSGESTESLASADNSSFRRIEFHIAKKPFTKGGDDGSFRLETLNPTTSSLKNTHGEQPLAGSESVGGGYSGTKRDASELENGLDQELSFGITFRRIGAGLENLGNTCFLNSVLQCLTYTEPLAAYLQSGKHQVTCQKSGFCALCAIQKHVSHASQLSGRSLAPKDLVSNLRCISRTFRNSRQEDAHEYMVNLLESMHKCCLPNGLPIESQSAYDKSLVHKIFGGQLRNQVKCMQCNFFSNKIDSFLDLSLEILNADTLYKAFANFTAKEQLDGGAKQYQCQQCKQKVKALKQLTVYKAPNVLTVHLKRFGCFISGQKIVKRVHFGPTLDLKPFVTGPYDGDLKYTLYGVLVHAGWSTHSGHYYCFVRTSGGMWYALDDNRVFQVSENKVFEQKAYMLFYFKDRKNSLSKNSNVHQREKIVMIGATNGPGVPREDQMKTGLSNRSLNVQTSLKSTAEKENIVRNGTPNGPGALREAQMNTGLNNGSLNLNAHISLATTVGIEKSMLISAAPTETQTNPIVSNGSIKGHKSLVSVTAPNWSGAPKEVQMKTGLNDGSLTVQKTLAAVGIEDNGLGPVTPEETQTNSNLSNSLIGQKSSPIAGIMITDFSTASESEHIQSKETSVSISILDPCKTEDQTKKIGGDESSVGNSGGGDYMLAVTALLKTSIFPELGNSMEKKAHGGKTHNMGLSDSPQKESFMKKNAYSIGKPLKKVKNFKMCNFVSTKFSSNVLLGTSLNQRKKKKHKRDKRVRKHAPGNLVNEAQETVGRMDEDGAVLATCDLNTKSQLNPKESNQLENSISLSQKDLLHMLTIGIDDRTVPRWDDDESAAQSQTFTEKRHDLTIGYIGDEWDEEYDRGKRKKVRISKTEFDGKNSFQDIANLRLKPLDDKQNLWKIQSIMTKRENKHFKNSGAGN